MGHRWKTVAGLILFSYFGGVGASRADVVLYNTGFPTNSFGGFTLSAVNGKGDSPGLEAGNDGGYPKWLDLGPILGLSKSEPAIQLSPARVGTDPGVQGTMLSRTVILPYATELSGVFAGGSETRYTTNFFGFAGSMGEIYVDNRVVSTFSLGGPKGVFIGDAFAFSTFVPSGGAHTISIEFDAPAGRYGQSAIDDFLYQATASYTVNPAAIPEPGPIALAGLGGLIALAYGRFGRRHAGPRTV